jgi:hypothetical protein
MASITITAGTDSSLVAAVESFIAASGADFTSHAQMEGQCQDFSVAIAAHLAGVELLDEDGDVAETSDAWPAQKWMDAVPAAIAHNELAGGHYVAIVDWHDGYRYEVDMTAAQFPELGWSNPRIRML